MYYESAINPIRNEEGKLEGVYMSGRDITEMVNSFHRLQKSVEKLQKGTDSIRQYIANIDYALSVSGVQLVNYYPHSYTFELINRETNSKLHMSQLRCIRLATMPFRRTVNSVLNRMDHLTRHDIEQADMAAVQHGAYVRRRRPRGALLRHLPRHHRHGGD